MTAIEEGITFILSHFQEPIFPRRIFTPIQKQIKIENTNDILKYFKEYKLYDCRISAFPFLENWYIKLHGPQPPDILFIDLDASQFKSGRGLYLALVKTLKNIQDRILIVNQPYWKVVLEDII
jgi:hypothetical protein